MDREIFALDIGTRKVMGIVAQKKEDGLEILDVEVIEHPSRPMLDGQIHSIEEVARTVRAIKENLESRLNKKLEKVGVAVAGRNLTTFKSKVAKEFDYGQEVTPDIVRDLELETVDKIISGLGSDLSQFYCVGYSPVYYELDGARISNLVGHNAKSIAVEAIVTFLPRVVLDGMFAVLKYCKLEATNITLEPISSINAIIPPEMRNLNLVLVDIGAGTSDLALTKDGVIFAYGMVDLAGDEVTERISEMLVVDFSTAERIKRALGEKDKIEYKDIWGRQRCADIHKLKEQISGVVKKVAFSIAKAGLALNGGVPAAIVAVGGGSLTYCLIEELAQAFGLPADMVGVRLPCAIKGVRDKTQKLTGPEAVTPIGIALMTAKSLGLRFINIEINRKKIKILDFQQKKDVIGALTLSGIIGNKRLYPRCGLALIVEVNGKLQTIKGTLGEPARILLNGKPVSGLSDKIQDGDKLEFAEATDGKDASVRVSDLLEFSSPKVVFNKEVFEVMPFVTMNGEEVGLDRLVPDGANIKVTAPTIKDVLKAKRIDFENLTQRQVLVNVNGNPRVLTQKNFTLQLNGKCATVDAALKQDDVIEFSFDKPAFYRIKDVIEAAETQQDMHINVNGRDIEVKIGLMQIFMNGRQVKPDEFLIDGANIKAYSFKKRQILLSEIFRYIEFDTQKVAGKSIRILVDDKPAGFITPLTEGSRVRIFLEERS